jgi:hypothetical protein
MFLHTDKRISKIFQNILREERLEHFQPFLLVGDSAKVYIDTLSKEIVCKGSYKPFQTFTGEKNTCYKEKCDCKYCAGIYKPTTILRLTGKENIEDFRRKIYDHISLHHGLCFIVCQNIDKFSKQILDSFLKSLEEPKDYVKILASASEVRNIPKTILSRFHTFYLKDLFNEDLKQFFQGSDEIKVYENLLNSSYDFYSEYQVRLHKRFSFEDYFEGIFYSVSLVEYDSKISRMFKIFKEDENIEFEDILLEFLKYVLFRILHDVSFEIKDKNIIEFRQIVTRITSKFRDLFYCLGIRNNYMVNIENQIYNYFRSILVIKKIL